ncbi:hypothetical protein SteCoe_28960 [Stentor coeruleus]|uniref:Ubiquitin-like domain-containing protein n=1 Tax=Stentor coeruleus TaxID=5963 RepID=A0A1R2B6Z3_9CILI|nr:hypothetical protein SteCoe_28960 [Stentor coeruleus]
MEKSYSVQTLDTELFQLQFINENDFAEAIEEITGILTVCQDYYISGIQTQLEDIKNFTVNHISIINKEIPASRFNISTPSGLIRVRIANPNHKNLKSLLLSFNIECKNKNLIFPLDQISFYYGDTFMTNNFPLSNISHDSTINLILHPAYPSQIPIRIIVTTKTGKSFEICLYETQKISQIKEEIQNIIGIPPDQQRLIYEQMQLSDEKTLSYYNMCDKSEVTLALSLRGGGGPRGFSFNGMSNEVKIKFSENAPDWRIVRPGISFCGICMNIKCRAYNDNIISNSGLGVFDVNRQVGIIVCPICENVISRVRNCGFYMAEWKYFGIDSGGIERRGSGRAYEDKYSTFLDGDNQQWRVLRIAVWQK